ncbi:MAG: TonB-dependent receptor, partial [Bacteroidales bacterium]|nr:TonB-dependent receptor [Bacteroidales bacterium]
AISQTPILDSKVRFTEQTTTVRELLSELSKAGGFSFSYGKEVPLDKQIRVTDKSQSIRAHLEEIFEGDSLKYVEKARKILILPDLPVIPKTLPNQTIKGRIIDLDSKIPLVGVNVVLSSEGPLIGTITDEKGFFRFDEVPIGRHALQCSYIGYEPEVIPNFLISSGKEQVINVEMEESVIQLEEVEVSSKSYQSKPINDLTVVSGRSFSSHEVENIPGSFSDISRAALSFPGVVTSNDGQNHMIIRGNSPKGLQWRLEGIEIPNLNHFSEVGASGGGVNVLSNNMLASSDFLTGAFPAEYGNALSGVFDLRLRTGNNEKHEQTLQVGLLGTEVMVEGPLRKASNTTYIGQYRYSTLKLVQKMGAKLMSVPDFQDLSFKIYHPTERFGVFSIFGIGGLSHEEGESGYIWNSNMATVGISNNYTINPKTFIRSVVAVSGRRYTWDDEYNMGTSELPINQVWKTDIIDYTAKASFSFNRKINTKHKLKAGIIFEMAFNESYMGWFSDTLYNWYMDPNHPDFRNLEFAHSYVNSNESAATLQTYLNWKYRITEDLTLNTGAHFLQFYLNNTYSLEPRLGLQWEIHPRHILSAGFGIHSRKESMTLYTGEMTLFDGAIIQPNIGLELSKAQHYVLGYHLLISEYIHLKAEAYYQYMYDIPAYPFPPYFSSINFDYGFEGNVLTNHGIAYNKGVELTLEKFMSKGYHFIVNGTLYDSKYKTKTGDLFHTKYDGSYASNGLIGREFKVGKEKQNIISINMRYILIGGMRYLPIDREQSLAEDRQVRFWDNGFSEKAEDYFRIDLQFKFRRNKPRYTGEWSIDFMNLTNRQNMLVEYWDSSIRDYRIEYQNPFLPFINYRIQF